MPEFFKTILEFISQNRALVAGIGMAALFTGIAVVTLAVGLRRGRRIHAQADAILSSEKTASNEAAEKITTVKPEPHIKRTKLTLGDVANPWTQGVYERAAPEGKMEALLPAFAFDIAGEIHRLQAPELARGIDSLTLLSHCDTAAGVAIYGIFATLGLWHCGRSEYAITALKVAAHTQMNAEQRDLIRFLFQDIIGHPLHARDLPSLKQWKNPAFSAAVKLYTAEQISAPEWQKLEPNLAPALRQFYDIELARKLPVRKIYRGADKSVLFSEGLYYRNLVCLARYMNPKRWQRLYESDKRKRFEQWVEYLPCVTEQDALLQIANPLVYDPEDFTPALRDSIPRILANTRSRDWLFNQGKMPPLTHRLHYFKFFCLFKRYNEAVRCFATLSILRRDRATRLFYARALYSSGMQHDAWAEMSSLLIEFPRDAAVMNEAAIYAHSLGRHDEAAEIFALARGMYPDDATLAYNEAVFAEQFSKKQIDEKWSAVQKMTQPPVID